MVGLVCTALVYWCGSTIEEAQSMEAVGMVGPPTQTLRQQSEEEPPCFHRKSKKQTKQSKCKKIRNKTSWQPRCCQMQSEDRLERFHGRWNGLKYGILDRRIMMWICPSLHYQKTTRLSTHSSLSANLARIFQWKYHFKQTGLYVVNISQTGLYQRPDFSLHGSASHARVGAAWSLLH